MKQKRNIAGQAMLVLALLAPASAAMGAANVLPPPMPSAVSAQAARQAVAQGGGRWILAWQTHDAALMAALFAADGLEMGRGGVVTRGRRAVAQRFARLFGAIGPVQATRQTSDVWLLGGTIYESGRYAYTFTPLRPGQKAAVMAGSYVTVWQKQQNGQWLIHSDVAIPAR